MRKRKERGGKKREREIKGECKKMREKKKAEEEWSQTGWKRLARKIAERENIKE